MTNILKIPKLIYKINEIPIKIPGVFFVEINNVFIKLPWKCKGSRINKAVKKKKVGGFTPVNFKAYYKIIVCYW